MLLFFPVFCFFGPFHCLQELLLGFWWLTLSSLNPSTSMMACYGHGTYFTRSCIWWNCPHLLISPKDLDVVFNMEMPLPKSVVTNMDNESPFSAQFHWLTESLSCIFPGNTIYIFLPICRHKVVPQRFPWCLEAEFGNLAMFDINLIDSKARSCNDLFNLTLF